MKQIPKVEAILSRLVVIPNFLDEQTCCELIAVHKRFGTLTGSSDNGLYLPEMRQKDSPSFIKIKYIIRRVIRLICVHHHEHVGCDLALICAITGYFRHTLHADNAMVVCPKHGSDQAQLVKLNCQCEKIEVKPNHTPWRKYTALLYLDSDHVGGNIVFGEGPNMFGKIYRKGIDVKRGLLVLSPSNELYYHRTTRVSRGVRYSMNLWFTSDDDHICDAWRSRDSRTF